MFYVTSCMHIFLYLFSCSMSFVRKMSFLTFCAAIVKFSWNVVFLREMSLYHIMMHYYTAVIIVSVKFIIIHIAIYFHVKIDCSNL